MSTDIFPLGLQRWQAAYNFFIIPAKGLINGTFIDTRVSLLTYRYISQEANQLILYHQYVHSTRGLTGVHPKLPTKAARSWGQQSRPEK